MGEENHGGQGERGRREEELDSYLSEMLRNTIGNQVAETNSNAPIILPDREDLTIRLVSQHSLERLRDAEQDKAIYDNLLWCLMGAIIGFFTNVVTGGQPVETVGYVFLACMIVAMVAILVMRRRLIRRLSEARERVHVGRERASEEE